MVAFALLFFYTPLFTLHSYYRTSKHRMTFKSRMKLCRTDCFVTLKYLYTRVHTPVVLSYDNSYDEQLEIILFCSAFINHVSFI